MEPLPHIVTRVDRLRASQANASVGLGWFQLCIVAALPLLGTAVNLAVPWYSDGGEVVNKLLTADLRGLFSRGAQFWNLTLTRTST